MGLLDDAIRGAQQIGGAAYRGSARAKDVRDVATGNFSGMAKRKAKAAAYKGLGSLLRKL